MKNIIFGIIVILILGSFNVQNSFGHNPDFEVITSEDILKFCEFFYEEYEILEEIFDKYEEFYIDDINKQELIEDAAKGMVYGTGDVYGAYFTPEEYKEFVMADNGE